MSHIFSIYSSGEGHLGCYQLLAIMNKAVMNIEEHVSMSYGRASLGYVPRSDMIGSSVRAISNFLRNLQIDFQSGFTSLQCN